MCGATEKNDARVIFSRSDFFSTFNASAGVSVHPDFCGAPMSMGVADLTIFNLPRSRSILRQIRK